MTAKLKGRSSIFGIIALVAYVAVYLATTTVRPQGTGGLSGPLKVRVFASESHLALMYPLYLVERWIRNGSSTDCSYRFNCDFKDQVYAHDWLYGDGKYGQVWYADGKVFLVFLAASTGLALLGRKWRRYPLWFSSVIGLTCSTLVAFGVFSTEALHMWEQESLLIKARSPVLHLTVVSPYSSTFTMIRSAQFPTGRGGTEGVYSFSDQVEEINSSGFKVLFTLEQPSKPIQVCSTFFPYGVGTRTKWNGFRIEGKSLEKRNKN